MIVPLVKKFYIRINGDLRGEYSMQRETCYAVLAFDSEDDTVLVPNDEGRIMRLDYEESAVEKMEF